MRNPIMDYYNVLKVNRYATEEELKTSYKRLALIHHPDKHPPEKRIEAERRFILISQAYDILSNPVKRKIYDQYGEEGLQYGGAAPPQHCSSSRQHCRNAQYSAYQCNPRSADDIYNDFFRRENGSEVLKKKDESIERMLFFTLEELYNGTSRRVKITRTVINNAGYSNIEEEVLTVDVKAGWKKGTKVTFNEKGDKKPGIIPADIVFVIGEKPHARYTRNGNDLVITEKITVADALTNKTLEIPALDGRSLLIQLPNVVTPDYEHKVPNEGMPITKQPGRKGTLKIKFDIKYPSRLTPQQKSDLRSVLS